MLERVRLQRIVLLHCPSRRNRRIRPLFLWNNKYGLFYLKRLLKKLKVDKNMIEKFITKEKWNFSSYIVDLERYYLGHLPRRTFLDFGEEEFSFFVIKIFSKKIFLTLPHEIDNLLNSSGCSWSKASEFYFNKYIPFDT